MIFKEKKTPLPPPPPKDIPSTNLSTPGVTTGYQELKTFPSVKNKKIDRNLQSSLTM